MCKMECHWAVMFYSWVPQWEFVIIYGVEKVAKV